MENNKDKLEAVKNTQNSPAALSDEQLGAVTGGGGVEIIYIPAPARCEVCGSTNIVLVDHDKGYAWTCGDCGEILEPYYIVNYY